MDTAFRDALVEGVSDAVGFVLGGVLGFGIGQLLGWSIFEPGFGPRAIAGIVLCGIGGGLGLRVARTWRRSQRKEEA
ncbi:hypothetical protein [Ramlibacter sp. PS4R-6]|uniref:hypothetical protein n=1 Tax=Ramlibacter sp. PS4R-6 TaxID=3133438 RepID=UPI0030B405DC